MPGVQTEGRKDSSGKCKLLNRCGQHEVGLFNFLFIAFIFFSKIGFVIHAIGPVYNNYHPLVSKELLQCVTLNILETAKELEVTSVSIPAISSGVNGYPKKECAAVMMKSTIGWFRRGNCGKLK